MNEELDCGVIFASNCSISTISAFSSGVIATPFYAVFRFPLPLLTAIEEKNLAAVVS
jgi:hypothetical protein